MKRNIVIIGGGPAGLAAAAAAVEAGEKDVLILERDNHLGGILNQCIHNGFGLHTFKEELTGPEYAARFEERVHELGIEYKLGTMVLSISPEKVVTAVSKEDGLVNIEAKAIILAMGCRERSRGALNIPGFRPAGVFSAGTAQRLVNMEGYMPGKEVVILGSGDIGLIMARRMTFEGAKVHVVAELQPYSGGLKRNIVQCLDDYGIPLKLSHTVTEIHGKERVTGVTISQVDERFKPIPGTETLFLSGKEVVGSCPRCGNAVTETKKGFFCENPGCSFALWKENRFFTAKKKELTKSIVSDLLRKGSTQLKGCYSPKTGTTYNATVILTDDGNQTDFKLDFGSR